MCTRQTNLPNVIIIANEVTDNHQTFVYNTCSSCEDMRHLLMAESRALKSGLYQTQSLILEVIKRLDIQQP